MKFESSVFEHKPRKRVEAGSGDGKTPAKANEFCISGERVLTDRQKMAEDIQNLGSAGNRKYKV